MNHEFFPIFVNLGFNQISVKYLSYNEIAKVEVKYQLKRLFISEIETEKNY